MKKILITRKLMKSSEEYALKIFNVKLNKKDRLLTKNELISNSSDCDGILSSLTEKFDADIISKLSDKVKIISNFAVGFGNIGCITQITRGTKIPILHTVEIIDWYTGGPKPKVLQKI